MTVPFAAIHARAAERKGGDEALARLLPQPRPATEIRETPDDRWLAQATRCVFQMGFNWKVVDSMWPGFEAAFEGFDPARWEVMTPEDFERLIADRRIVRHAAKIRSVERNAAFFRELADEHGSVGSFIAAWPASDFAGLLETLKRRGDRLGGLTGQYFLRAMGVDGFVLSRDGVAALIDAGIIDKAPTSKSAMAAVQKAYNAWSQESGLPLMAISRILGLSIGANSAGVEF
ncbi:DNA-3-methyladenine glycosylase I [Limibaculum sp. M0105]|uniref:DNA-3-methyladenine glycosylase I n=1 Tax=Thermohalobaculum xanthum TaxID=2753746 RepID=A0A8J7M4X9_9RHOB|nr:DNA-3-methyladenine glycosylase I [Thermohalobaculum xanthum]MBK0398358.1 DNA-3-methyladenine glycosylase I [Thermohalobaculum xanthum]